MEIIIGTYEEFLVGYRLVSKSEDSPGFDSEDVSKRKKLFLKQSFSNHAHSGSIRTIASSNKFIASGASDEIINLINIKHRVEKGTLSAHNGTITDLKFFRSSYLFSASDDGKICVWDTHKWQCQKILHGHKGSIKSIDLHSSGKILLSLSSDKTLRAWNLIKGRCAYIINIKDVANQVLWSPTNHYFAIVFNDHIDVYDIGNGSIVHSIVKNQLNYSKRLGKLLFIDDNHLIISGDEQELIIYRIDISEVINRFNAHENRVKDIELIDLETIKDDSLYLEQFSKSTKFLVTISSDKLIKIWSIDCDNLKTPPILIAEIDVDCRPTCMTVWTNNQNLQLNGGIDIPELKLSDEELETCRAKLKSKRIEKQNQIATIQNTVNSDTNTSNDSNSKEFLESNQKDDDDELIIKSMRSESKILKSKSRLKGKKLLRRHKILNDKKNYLKKISTKRLKNKK
ncbi:serine/threonine-protein kinase [Sarcoptes scabiei]|nr:serine/threonine-protein kinase [Sarcoptes scabiei]